MKIGIDNLEKATIDILKFLGEPVESAKVAAEILLTADMRGVSTHGTNLLRMAFKRVEAGMLSIPTKTTVVREDETTAVLDGNNGLGQIAAHEAMAMAIAKAKKYGLGMVLVRNTNNVGSLGYYVNKATTQGMAAIMMTNGNASMAPFGGSEPYLGTNPIAFAVPSGSGIPIMLDMSSSVVARGKIRLAALKGETIPMDWALDGSGKPTTDPKSAIDGCLLPMGGPKGSGLAIIVDIFSGMLSGSKYSRELKSFHELDGPTGVGASFMAIDIARFMDLKLFGSLVDGYRASFKACKKLDGVEEILLPGEIEFRKELSARKNGVEMSGQVMDALNEILAKAGSTARLRGV
jgi:LDH2 family malate/lactate/ureidoglycolate dehydrogenase